MTRELYIVLDNYGFPRFADEDCEKIRYFLTLKDAQEVAAELATERPNTVYSIFKRVAVIYNNSSDVEARYDESR